MENDIIEGTGNIFADLGLADAADRQTKTRLEMAVNAIVKECRLKQTDTAAILGIPKEVVKDARVTWLCTFSIMAR